MSGVRQQSSSWQDQLKDVKTELLSEGTYQGYVLNHSKRRSKRSRAPNPFEGVTFGPHTSSNEVKRIGDICLNPGPNSMDIQGLGLEPRRNDVTGGSDADTEAFMGDSRDQSSSGEGDYESGNNHTKPNVTGGRTETEGVAKEIYNLDLLIARLESELKRRDGEDIQQSKNRKVERAVVWTSLAAGTITVVAGAFVLIVGMIGDHKSNIMNL